MANLHRDKPPGNAAPIEDRDLRSAEIATLEAIRSLRRSDREPRTAPRAEPLSTVIAELERTERRLQRAAPIEPPEPLSAAIATLERSERQLDGAAPSEPPEPAPAALARLEAIRSLQQSKRQLRIAARTQPHSATIARLEAIRSLQQSRRLLRIALRARRVPSRRTDDRDERPFPRCE